MTCPMAWSPRPIAISRPAPSARPSAMAAWVSCSSSGASSRRRFSSRARISWPSVWLVRSSSCRIHCLILCRARAVWTWLSQSRLGRALGPVRISTVSPLRSSRWSGAIRPLIRAPWQRRPTSVWTMKARSIGVAPRGSRFTSPRGVKTKISSWYRSTLRNSRNSSGECASCCSSMQLAEPGEVLVQLVPPGVALVDPVGRDAVLRRPVHFQGPDLDLEELAAGAEDRGVQRLVGVRLGTGDVVLEPLLDRGPVVVDDAQHVVAVRDASDQHPDRHQVVDLLEGLLAPLHLLPDRPEVLGPAGDLEPLDPGPAELLLERGAHPLDHLLAGLAAGGDQGVERGVVLGLEEPEGQVLQLRLDSGHAEAVGQRGVDLPRLGGDPEALLGRQVLERPHVVEPVGQLDDDDPGVLGDREQELAVVLHLLLRPWSGR